MMYRRLPATSIFREMDRLQREMNRLLESVQPRFVPRFMRTAPSYPAMNIWTNEDGAVITAEVPGVQPEDINVSVIGETLTLSGERKPDQVGEDVRYHRQERGHGKFSRSIELPFRVEVDQVEATFDQGVLHITMPRAEEDKPKEIQIKTA